MRLKIITTALVMFGLFVLFAGPLIIGPRPGDGAPKRELASYGVRMLAYFGITAAAFLGAATGAVLIVRQTQREFRERTRENLRELIEGSLRDHGRRE